MTKQVIDVGFSVSNPWPFDRFGLPLRVSVPLAEGSVMEPGRELMLVDEAGRDVGAQWRVLSKWKDGSARFALMDYAEGKVEARKTSKLKLMRREAAGLSVAEKSRIKVTQTEGDLTVDTGRLKWVFCKKEFVLAKEIHAHGREWVKGLESDMVVVDTAGQVYRASEGTYAISLEYDGPYRMVVLIEGEFANDYRQYMTYKSRYTFTAGGSQVLLSHTIRNRHDGREGKLLNRWGLYGAVNLKNTTRRIEHTTRGRNTENAMVEVRENVDIDTGDYNTLLRNGASLREKEEDVCYVVRNPTDMSTYGNVTPMVDIYEKGFGGLLLKWAMPAPTYEGPLHMSSEKNRFAVDFYDDIFMTPPGRENYKVGPMKLNEGMGKTRDVLFNFHDDSLSAQDTLYDSDVVSYPGVSGVPGKMYREAKFADVHLTLMPQMNKYPVLESKIDTLLAAQWAYDWPKASGWRDYGDEVGSRGRCPEFGVQQFINNEEDYLYCLMIDAWRLGKPYKGRDQARHLMDIDYIDYSPDKSRDGGCCPHSTEHTNGEVYPSHQWCQGLLYYYLATGDMEALRISKRIGDCLIWWITGPRKGALRGSGREAAWPLLGLSALYEVTGEKKYLDAAMVVVDELAEVVGKYGQLMFEYPMGSGILSSYMALMTFNGVWDVYAASGDEKVLELWKKISKPYIDGLSDPASMGYLHFRNWPIKWADLTVLARWYHLTGDEKYVKLGKNGLRLIMAGCPQPLNQTQGFIAMGYRHFIVYLKLADEFGMIDDDACTLVW